MMSRVWKKRMVALLTAVAILIPLFPFRVYAEAEYAEWWNFRNTVTNNAVTTRPTPTSDREAWEKWARKYTTESGTLATPTPPVIANGKLYVGVSSRIAEIDKETGEVLRWSETMPGNVGYAMQSPVYANGRVFIAITNGRICAVDVDDMSVAWVTDNSGIIRGQTVSPLNYVEIDGVGYISTGTWTTAGGDLICATTDDSGVTVDAQGNKIKPLTWTFNPGESDAENLAANDCVAVGYYWTGAYVTENYLAIGSDNGSEMGDEIDDTAFYTVDPRTGAIIDAVYGIRGQVRSTAVYDNGCLYFSTKGAKIYKIPVDENGALGEASYIDMGEYGAAMATATPVVYGGKIYLGVQGRGGQFSSDGGHAFVVARDDAVLSQSSFVYRIPIPGYPQAGALLSTYHEDEDYDGDGEADGRVYLFFTYNSTPGGIFYTYDTPGQTAPTQLTTEEARIFVPGSGKQQYCISSIVVDASGNLYYKNDSGYLFAVESNPASLGGMTVRDAEGEEIRLDKVFAPKTAEYSCVVGADTGQVTVELVLEEGVSATVNGAAYTAGGSVVDLAEDVTEIPIVTNKAGKRRMYSLTVSKVSADADLLSLASTMRNTVPDISDEIPRRIDPAFDKDVTEYSFDWITTGLGDSDDPAGKRMMNIFLKPSAEGATVRVWPEEKVDTSAARVLHDGSVRVYPVQNSDLYDYSLRFPVYSADIKHDSKVRIEVTAEDGRTTKDYFVTFNRRVYVADLTLDQNSATIDQGEELQLTATVLPENATEPEPVWTSSDEEVATVDAYGLVRAIAPGTATIIAASEDGPEASCEITVMEADHLWGEVSYKWSEDNSEVTATRVCVYDPEHVETETVSTSSEITVEADCEAEGKERFTAVFVNTAFATQTKTVSIKARGHEWNDGEVTTEPGVTVAGVITYTCKNNETHVHTETVPAGWRETASGMTCVDAKGKLVTGWKMIDSEWYFFDANGKMASSAWARDSRNWYWMGADGKIAKNVWAKDSTGWCRMGNDGTMAKNGWILADGEWYYIKPDGCRAENMWAKDSANWYWMGADGKIAKNVWAKDSSGWCRMGNDGKITKSGWIQADSEWYYIKANGYRAENMWAKDSANWYWMGADGKIAKNVWAKDSSGWCWMGNDGKITKDSWIEDGGNRYYLKSNGYMAADEWARDSTGWMWMDGSGRITKSKWIRSGGSWYYLKADGYMAANEYVQDSRGRCWMGGDGKWDGKYR